METYILIGAYVFLYHVFSRLPCFHKAEADNHQSASQLPTTSDGVVDAAVVVDQDSDNNISPDDSDNVDDTVVFGVNDSGRSGRRPQQICANAAEESTDGSTDDRNEITIDNPTNDSAILSISGGQVWATAGREASAAAPASSSRVFAISGVSVS